MSIAVFSEIFPVLQTALVDNVVGLFGGFLAIATPAVVTGIAIYFVIYGISVMRGKVQHFEVDVLLRLLSFALGLFLVTALYGTFASAVSEGIPNQFAAAAGGGGGSNIGEIFDRMLNVALLGAYQIEESINEALNEFGTLEFYKAFPVMIAGYLTIGLIGLASLLAATAGFIVSLVAIFALALLAAVGPIFLLAGIFEQTRQFMFGWIAAVINYLMLLVITIIVVAAVNTVINSVDIDFTDPLDYIREALFVVAIYGLGIFLFVQTPAIAASLGGGAGAAVNGTVAGLFGRGTASAGGAAGRAGAAGGRAAGRGIARAGGAAASAVGRANARAQGRRLVNENR